MTENEQRIVLAEFDGWTYGPGFVIPFGADKPENIWFAPSGKGAKSGLPDYLHDLNAVRSLVKNLDYQQLMEFVGHCRDISHRKSEVYVLMEPDSYCEALLRTIGKWTALFLILATLTGCAHPSPCDVNSRRHIYERTH